MKKRYLLLFLLLCSFIKMNSQHSLARQWNEKVLNSIRSDFARPTVHARNLFHTSIAMYDAWAFYGGEAETYFLGKTVNGFTCTARNIDTPFSIEEAQAQAMSYAVYRLIRHRFQNAPEVDLIYEDIDSFMDSLGYNINYTSIDYSCSPAAMGNYMADQLIKYGLQDGSNEIDDYANRFYEPVNSPIVSSANFVRYEVIEDINRWQPISFPGGFVGQGGFSLDRIVPEFLSPEWGQVSPFSLQSEDLAIYNRDGFDYWIYHDPGPPPYLNMDTLDEMSKEYKWGHSLVGVWSSHLSTEDSVMWDISPASIGNLSDYPAEISGYKDFYNLIDGGDSSTGHLENPATEQPYQPQIVPRGDYARVLAEFWADGPDSETPPGHWFTILNYVNDHPDFEKKYRGAGEELDDLEWDVKAYFMLGGAMHDAAISAWGIKGWYDYIRPISAIRAMASYGQGSDPSFDDYHVAGLPLIPEYIEEQLDGGACINYEDSTSKYIFMKSWRGPEDIVNPFIETAGVSFICPNRWLPFQKSSFVTPPFSGYVSGHSTFSRAAAEVLTELTGDPFFPGGMGEFYCEQNEFLVFEDGPSQDVTLQWATYRDASDQCSLSRIWGGIHPPADDIPGRLIGIEIGQDAFDFANQYFTKTNTSFTAGPVLHLYPNPATCSVNIDFAYEGKVDIQIFQIDGKIVNEAQITFSNHQSYLYLGEVPAGVYFIVGRNGSGKRLFEEKIVTY